MGLARAASSSWELSSSCISIELPGPLSLELMTCLDLDFTSGAVAAEVQFVRVTMTLFEFVVVRFELMAVDDCEIGTSPREPEVALFLFF